MCVVSLGTYLLVARLVCTFAYLVPPNLILTNRQWTGRRRMEGLHVPVVDLRGNNCRCKGQKRSLRSAFIFSSIEQWSYFGFTFSRLVSVFVEKETVIRQEVKKN